MRIVTKILTAITVCFLLLIVSFSIYLYNSTNDTDNNLPYLEFTVNEKTREIIVSNAKNLDFNWEDISVSKGYALLPKGSIDINDKITNCYGDVEIVLPGEYGSVTYEDWHFIDRPVEEFEELRFWGEWEGEGNDINFYPDGTYLNHAWSFDGPDNNTPEPEPVLQGGSYAKTDFLLIQNYDQSAPMLCDVSFSADDTVVEISCYDQRTQYKLVRDMSNETYLNILNESQKIDSCLSSFISNYTNKSYEEILTNGLNVSVTFTDYLSSQEVYNITSKNIDFNIDDQGNISCQGTNYSINVNSLQDLYNLVYRVDVILISADDVKFGCN